MWKMRLKMISFSITNLISNYRSLCSLGLKTKTCSHVFKINERAAIEVTQKLNSIILDQWYREMKSCFKRVSANLIFLLLDGFCFDSWTEFLGPFSTSLFLSNTGA